MLSQYSSFGLDDAKMTKSLQPLFLLQMLQFWGNAEDFGKRKAGVQGLLGLSRKEDKQFL